LSRDLTEPSRFPEVRVSESEIELLGDFPNDSAKLNRALSGKRDGTEKEKPAGHWPAGFALAA